MTATRRLAAILAADVVGYSRLIGADEEGTLNRLRSIRVDIIDPTITEHRGRIVKTTGDGLLVEFSSVVDALRCATEWQRGMPDRNAGTSDDPIEFRIGINVELHGIGPPVWRNSPLTSGSSFTTRMLPLCADCPEGKLTLMMLPLRVSLGKRAAVEG